MIGLEQVWNLLWFKGSLDSSENVFDMLLKFSSNRSDFLWKISYISVNYLHTNKSSNILKSIPSIQIEQENSKNDDGKQKKAGDDDRNYKSCFVINIRCMRRRSVQQNHWWIGVVAITCCDHDWAVQASFNAVQHTAVVNLHVRTV